MGREPESLREEWRRSGPTGTSPLGLGWWRKGKRTRPKYAGSVAPKGVVLGTKAGMPEGPLACLSRSADKDVTDDDRGNPHDAQTICCKDGEVTARYKRCEIRVGGGAKVAISFDFGGLSSSQLRPSQGRKGELKRPTGGGW